VKHPRHEDEDECDHEAESTSPMRARVPRAPLPKHEQSHTSDDVTDAPAGMSHEDLVEALRAIDGLRDVGKSHPNFHFRSRPFLHLHVDDRASTPTCGSAPATSNVSGPRPPTSGQSCWRWCTTTSNESIAAARQDTRS